jgi:hypothetical protein
MYSQFADTRTPIDLSIYRASKKVSMYLAFVNNVVNYVSDPDAYENIIHLRALHLNIQILLQKMAR